MLTIHKQDVKVSDNFQTFSVVIPVLNEVGTIDELIERCVAACEATGLPFEIVVVDDGSTDGSSDRIEAASKEHEGKVVGVFLNRNYGQHPAVIAGIAHSRGDFVITMDGDLQNPPEEIPRFVDAVRQGYDVVGGIRKDRKDSWLRRAASSLINRQFRKWTGIIMHDYGCMMRAYSRHVADAVARYADHGVYVPVLANSFAKRYTEIPISHNARACGRSKYSLAKLVMIYLTLLAGMTTLPIPLAGIMCGVVAVVLVTSGIMVPLAGGYPLQGPGPKFSSLFFGLLAVSAGALLFVLFMLSRHTAAHQRRALKGPLYFVHRVAGISSLGSRKR